MLKTRTAAFAIVLSIGLAGMAQIVSGTPGTTQRNRSAPTGDDQATERAIKLARDDERSTIELIVVVRKESDTEKVLDESVRLGATLLYKDSSIGYLHLCVPLERVRQLRQSPEILTSISPLSTALGDQGSDASGEVQNFPDKTLTPEAVRLAGGDSSPYANFASLGLPQLRKQHPSYDGRGVTVALIDNGLPLDAPELSTGLRLDGSAVRKITAYEASGDPVLDCRDPPTRTAIGTTLEGIWIPTKTVQISNHRFAIDGVEYRASFDGPAKFGILKLTGPPYERSINVASGTKSSPEERSFAVLYRVTDGRVLLDTDRNRSFEDETPIAGFAQSGEVVELRVPLKKDVYFYQGEPLRHIFAVDVRRQGDYLALLDASEASHGAMCAATLAGVGLYQGAFEGAAPGTRIALSEGVRRGPHSYSDSIEQTIALLENPSIDLISTSHIGLESTFREDCGSAMSVILDRLTRVSHKFIVKAAGNEGPSDLLGGASADFVLTAGAFIAKETQAAFYGSQIATDDMTDTYSVRGPSADGGFPSFLAPSELITLGTAVGQPTASGKLLAGYSIGGGTSNAAPALAGTVAALLSGAKQESLPQEPIALLAALRTSATFLPGVPAAAQGNGLPRVDKAIEALRHLPALHDLLIQAPVHSSLGASLTTPNQGKGIVDRDGLVRTMYRVRLKLKEGEATSYKVDILQMHPDFGVPSSIRLSSKQWSTLTVKVTSAVEPHASAIVRLVDRKTGVVVGQIPVDRVSAPTLDSRHPRQNGAVSVNEWGVAKIYFYIDDTTHPFDIQAEGPVQMGFLVSPEDSISGKRAYCGDSPKLHCSVGRPTPGLYEFDTMTSAHEFDLKRGTKYDNQLRFTIALESGHS